MREVERRIPKGKDDHKVAVLIDNMHDSGTADPTTRETIAQMELLMMLGRLVLDNVSPRAHDALFSDQTLRDHFLEPKSECAAFIMSIDIRRSAELILKARTAELFGQFMARLCDELRRVICDRFGIVDKFTGDGLLASFPEFFIGPDAWLSSHLGHSRSAHGVR